MKHVRTTTAVLVCVNLVGYWLAALGVVGGVVLVFFWDGLWWAGLAVAGVGLLVVFASEALLREVDPMDGGWP